MSPIERFFTHVDKTEYCWLWKGGLSKNGYGQFWLNNHTVSAHRFIWEATNGNIPEGYYICHKCDNPKCVNPSHLFMGTHLDNMKDMVNKNRSTKGDRHSFSLHPELIMKGENHPMAKLTTVQVMEVKQLFANGKNSYEIANQFNVGRRTIQDILRGKSWKHIKEL